MKLVYTLFILLLSTLTARAESRVSDSVACVTLLGVGAYCADVKGDMEEVKVVVGTVFSAAGLSIAAGSIPLLVVAHRLKKDAKRKALLTLNCSIASTPLANGAKRGNVLLGACLNF